MATTLLKLKELSQQTIEAIVKSPDAWKKYLNAAPNIFRYSFEDQLLIYAQAPKATAVATYDVWNRIMYRAVKRGSSGIGLIHAKRRYEKIDYVFDVSQTVERYDSRPLNIWKVTDENESQIREYLQDMLSVDELSASIPDLMQSLVKESVEDVIDDLYDALKENVNGTYLDGLEDDQLKYEFRELLNHSIYYVCLGKCGYDPDMYVTNDAFDFITNFNDLSVLRHLGYATTETCNSILHGITICLERNRKRTSQERMVQDTVPVDFKKQDVPNFGTPEHEEIVLSSEPDNHVMRTLPEHPIQIEDVEKGENDYIQLEFLPSEEQQTEQIQLEIGSHELKNNENLILDSEIDAILRLGGGENNSQYSIAARLIKGIDQEAFAAFLSEEYGTGGKGVYLNERKISVWYDQDGLRFARGDSAQEQYDRIMTWQEVSERMISMYEQGNFLPNSIVTDAMKVTGEEYAVRLELMFRDAGILPDEMRHTEEWGDTIQAMLYEKSGQEKIMELFDEIDQAFQEDPSLPGWIQSNNKKYRRIFKELTPDRNHYVLQSMDIAIPQEQFITEDEILSTLGRGSGVSNGKERIYNYLTDISEQHSVQDRIKFLKNEYGIGGRKPGIIGAWHSSEDHDAKGILLEKEFCDKVQLTWSSVLQRIEALIQRDQYLTEEEAINVWFDDAQKIQKDLENVESQEIVPNFGTPQTMATQNDRIRVAIESTEDFEDRKIGFFTFHYPDGRVGIRFRLVKIGDHGVLQAYPQPTRFFINFEAINEYIREHVDELDVISYDDIVHEAWEKRIPTEIVPDIQQEENIEKPQQEKQENEKTTKVGNFHITNEQLGTGTPKEKYRRNVEAIQLLKQLEEENRQADRFEQETLSNYVGWGGLSDVFDANKQNWAEEYNELKELLTDAEYKAARESVLNAHFTQPVVIESIYKALEQMGFKSGNILEPSMGIGNFFGVMPESMRESKLYGVELDDISGQIARQLYPDAEIRITGYENSGYPDDFFDVAVGNVPFGNYQVYDRRYERHHFMIHDYFLAKTLDQLRSGGVAAFITSKGTMDKKSDTVRLYLSQRAELLGAIRLPNTAFKANAGTEVTSDILFFQKREGISYDTPEWLQIGVNEEGIELNQYFMESKHVGNEEDDKTELQVEMDRLADSHGDDYPPVRDYRKLKEGAAETVRSIIIMVNAMLRLCETSALKRLFEDDDIDIPSLGLGVDGNPNKKTALFLVMPDNDQSFNFLISMFYTQLFDVLIRIADHKCNGSLPIHVRLWADEFYAGPKPTNTEVLMGTIRSRNMSIVPILQSIAQIKAIFPQDKWEVFLDNCAVMIYLGSGPAAFSTHEYISKLLGEMTIDTRNDGVTTGVHGNSSLNNQRAGRGLMTPGEVKRMDRKKCLIFMEGQYPIMDWKNLPFDTAVWKESKRLAGKTGYKHPVRVVYNPKTMTYRTIRNKQDFQVLDKKDVEFYKEAEKTDRSIKVCEINEEDFLYLNFDTNPTPTEEELIQMFEQSKKDTGLQEKAIEMEEQSTQDNISVVPNFGTEGVVEEKQEDEWDLSGTINQCIQRYAERLTEDQLNEILLGLENGLTEEEVKSYFTFPVEKMNQYRRAYQFMQ